MIYGIGVDLTHVPRIEAALRRWQERFLNKVFSADEISFCRRRKSPAHCLAMRFAAKEAFSKALGTGMRRGVYWRDIEVFHNQWGKPGLNIYGHALELVREARITGIHLSLSDENDYALAMVVLEQ